MSSPFAKRPKPGPIDQDATAPNHTVRCHDDVWRWLRITAIDSKTTLGDLLATMLHEHHAYPVLLAYKRDAEAIALGHRGASLCPGGCTHTDSHLDCYVHADGMLECDDACSHGVLPHGAQDGDCVAGRIDARAVPKVFGYPWNENNDENYDEDYVTEDYDDEIRPLEYRTGHSLITAAHMFEDRNGGTHEVRWVGDRIVEVEELAKPATT